MFKNGLLVTCENLRNDFACCREENGFTGLDEVVWCQSIVCLLFFVVKSLTLIAILGKFSYHGPPDFGCHVTIMWGFRVFARFPS